MPHPEPPHAAVQPSVHTRRRFLIAAGAGLTVTAAGVWLATSPVAPDVAIAPADPANPRGLAEYAPVYDRAVKALDVPLGYTDCARPTTRAARDTAGSDRHAVTPVIDRFIIHHTGTTDDQLDFFSRCNRRSSAPTFYLRHDGTVIELIRPSVRRS